MLRRAGAGQQQVLGGIDLEPQLLAMGVEEGEVPPHLRALVLREGEVGRCGGVEATLRQRLGGG